MVEEELEVGVHHDWCARVFQAWAVCALAAAENARRALWCWSGAMVCFWPCQLPLLPLEASAGRAQGQRARAGGLARLAWQVECLAGSWAVAAYLVIEARCAIHRSLFRRMRACLLRHACREACARVGLRAAHAEALLWDVGPAAGTLASLLT